MCIIPDHSRWFYFCFHQNKYDRYSYNLDINTTSFKRNITYYKKPQLHSVIHIFLHYFHSHLSQTNKQNFLKDG
jgi:hypothetical protein